MKVNIHAMLSFGLVNVPVGVASAVSKTNEPTFVTLHEHEDGTVGRIGEPKVCKVCGVTGESLTITKGYEYAKNEYLVFSEDDMARIVPERSPEIALRKFVKAAELKPLMVASHNFLVPNKSVNAGYGLLYQTLAELKAVGIGSHTLYGKEHPCAISANQDFPGQGVLMLHSLNVFEDLAVPDFTTPIPSREEKKTAKELIGTYMQPLVPSEDLVSSSRQTTQEFLALKIAGAELPEAEVRENKEITLDLHAMMKRDLEERVKEGVKATK